MLSLFKYWSLQGTGDDLAKLDSAQSDDIVSLLNIRFHRRKQDI